MSEFKMELSGDVEFILDRMKSSGYEAYVVGGSVRDSLIGRELGDCDITTNALPAETKSVFADHRTVDTGIKHGTVTLVLGGIPYEITTYRVDGDYKDNRHPESVTFTTRLEDDLSRRDFTVNAMAYNPERGICDPFGGREDAAARLIRAVGDPYKRFDEDALRILRALRFAAVLGFEIEETTARAVREGAHLLSAISKERIYTELKKLIMGGDATRILTEYSEVIGPLLSGLKIETLPDKALFANADMCTRFAALFSLNSDSPAEHSDRAFADLKTDKLTRSNTYAVLSAYYDVDFTTLAKILTHLYRYGEDTVRAVLSLGILLGRFTDAEERMLNDALSSGTPYSVSMLKVRGGDLASLGLRGESIGRMLEMLLLSVINGRVENDKTALVNCAKEMMFSDEDASPCAVR